MKDKTIWAARRAANVRQGDRLLGDPEMQKSLLFQKHDNVIFDKAGELNLAYYFPSAVGSAIFYYGHFELGEISLLARLLEAVPNPVVLDVGANVGSHSLEWAHRLNAAQVYAFEPVPSNIDLLARNVDENHLSGRVHIVKEAVGETPGSATFFETDDAAYSSLHDTQRRPVRATYDVNVTTIDAFVEREKLKAVTLIKIDVEGTEDAVIAGAARTIRRFKPLLFVEIYGGEHSNPNPRRTIETLIGLGYVPLVISDGIVTPYDAHDDNFYNYLFVHKSDARPLPPPDLQLKRELDAERLELIDKLTSDLQNASDDVTRAQRQWKHLDQLARDKEASLQEKDRAIQEIAKSSDDLEVQLQEKDRALRDITKASHDLEIQLHEKDRGLRDITKASHDLEVQLHEKDRALRDITKASHDLEAQLQEKDRALRDITKASHGLEAQLQDKERALQALLKSSHDLEAQLKEKDRAIEIITQTSRALEPQLQEKDALIGRFSESAGALDEQLQSLSRQVEEKQAALVRFDADLREKDALINRLSAELSENSKRFSELYAELEAKQASLEPMSKEIELLRKAAEERLATANELNGIAQERLAVIVSLNERLHELQGDA